MGWGEEEKGGRFWINGRGMFPGRCNEFQKKNKASKGLLWTYVAEGTVRSDSSLEDWRPLPKGNGVARKRWVVPQACARGEQAWGKGCAVVRAPELGSDQALVMLRIPVVVPDPFTHLFLLRHSPLWRWFIDPKTQGLSVTLHIILNINLSYKELLD